MDDYSKWSNEQDRRRIMNEIKGYNPEEDRIDCITFVMAVILATSPCWVLIALMILDVFGGK